MVKARELKINISTESNLWTVSGHGMKICELVEARSWKRNGMKICEAGIIYLNQLLDTEGKRLITWQQFKNYQN